jgi:Lysyl oxidase
MAIPGRSRRTTAAAIGAVACVALASGCGSTEGPLPPELVTSAAPHDKAYASAIDGAARPFTNEGSDEDAAFDAGAGDDSPGQAASDDALADRGDPDGPAACSFAACAPGAPCPDLVIDVDDLRASVVVSSRTFTPADCAVVEGCITEPGTRRLLRFDTATANIGTADLVVGSPTASACFQFSQCHQHYHFRGFSLYTLLETDGTTVAAAGHKQSFCLEDVEQYAQAPAPDPAVPFTCGNQGLHVGWEDVYPSDIDCQWIDITGVPPGNYLLEVAVNTAGYLPESNYANDSATVPVTIPAP